MAVDVTATFSQAAPAHAIAALAACDFSVRERVGGTLLTDWTERFLRPRLGSYSGEVVHVVISSPASVSQIGLLVHCDFFAGGFGSMIYILMQPRSFR